VPGTRPEECSPCCEGFVWRMQEPARWPYPSQAMTRAQHLHTLAHLVASEGSAACCKMKGEQPFVAGLQVSTAYHHLASADEQGSLYA